MTFRITAFLLFAFASGCSCPGTRPESARFGEQPPGTPAAVQQNFSYIEGVVDSVLPGDAERVELLVTVNSVRAGSGAVSMVEAGTRLAVTVDAGTDERLPAFILHLKQGDMFAGSLTKARDGHWILLEAAAR